MIDLPSFSILAQDAGPPAEAAAGVCFLLFYLACMGISMLLGVSLLVFWIWMIVDCATKEPSEGNDKLIWILVIVLAGWVGAAIYYFARRPTRIAKFGR